MIYMNKILILMNVYFNYEYVERTLDSIKANKGDFTIDFIFLENPSKYSFKIKELSKKYNINHYICNENIAGQIFQLFYSNNQSLLTKYDYICVTESDVVLDIGCIDEALYILNNLNNIGVCYVGLKLGLKKYKSIQKKIDRWVPKPRIKTFYAEGHTGIHFVVFKSSYFFNLMKDIENKRLHTAIALGQKKYFGFSDSNLQRFNKLNNFKPVQTIKNKLDHIGWETAIGLNNEYKQVKDFNLKTKKIRVNMNINDYYLTKVKHNI